MEFTIVCPVDGEIEVSLEDVDSVVLHEPERADITFTCPHCGSRIAVSAVVPSFLLAAIQALSDEPDAVPSNAMMVFTREGSSASEEFDDSRADAYCEYFRRQLEHVVDVEDALAEIDARL